MAGLKAIDIDVHVHRREPEIAVIVAGLDSFGTIEARERVPLSASTADLTAAAQRAIERWQRLLRTHLDGVDRSVAAQRAQKKEETA